MPGRGPPKKPTILKVIAGNPGNKPLPKNEPKPEALDSLAIPAVLKGADARAAWKRVAPKLKRMHVLSEADVDALMLYCRECQVYADAEKIVRAEGVVMPTDQGLKKHPAVTVMHEAATHMRNLMQSFGMTPASRASVEKLEERAPGSAWDDFERTG